jgi:DeoR/GlpR family transcriptional regulator of sugar metabolism
MREDRLRHITSMLRQHGRVEVGNLCRIFDVAEMTIRRDLLILASRNIAVRFHGGALLASSDILNEQPLELRMIRQKHEKEAIAKKAITLLNDGQTVFFDSSTTVLFLARLITNNHNLLVVTDTISTALELNSRTNIQVLCIGGELRKNTCSCFGVFAEQMISTMHFDMAFFSVPKVSLDGTLSTPSLAELPIKKNAIQRATTVVLLVDHSKLAEPDFLEQGKISDVDIVITDAKMPPDFLDMCRKAGVKTMVA